ncbi:hypothetical protein FHR92_005129 [Fontibacillus solani]|uniref:DUF7660 domain-containing protein n=1 Tax=Fontibacillus solani TaxID=1572857 RepID=A0A7W3XUG7_9BACL|nr:hypothetical protein [Fontibacillus solani]MBA9088611.1 hypothetical protein [Fontibacillus solani]
MKKTKKTLFELVNEVSDEMSFINFLNELRNDKLKSRDWGNTTIEAFLEASHEWGKVSVNGLQFYEKPENPWLRCAQIIYMGTIYE